MDHEACEVTAITMNTVVRNNLRVDIGDIVSVYQCADVEYGKRVHILPVKDTIESVTGNLLDEYLKRELLFHSIIAIVIYFSSFVDTSLTIMIEYVNVYSTIMTELHL